MPANILAKCYDKYLMSVILCIIVGLLSGCQGQQETSHQHFQIGIVLFGDSRQPQVKGFEDGMAELGYQNGKQISYIVRNAKNDRSKLKAFVQELTAKKVNLLVAAGGLEADIMKKLSASEGIPVVVLYINAIKERGLVDSRRNPGWGVTGIDNLNAELSGKRIEILKELIPKVQRVLVLYYKKIAPSRIGVEQAQIVANKYGIQIIAHAVSSREEVSQVMSNLRPGEVDAMLTVPTAPIDNALKDIILPHLQRLKLPLMTHSKALAQIGAVASYGANFYDMGDRKSVV